MQPLINIEDISAAAAQGTVFIDARSGADSYQRYLTGHLHGAHFVDLDRDLAAHPHDAAYGGRHPLPDVADFAALLGKLGITPNTPLIIYDDKAGANPAARLWWMLRAIGHERVQVINGDLQAAVDAGVKLDTLPAAIPGATSYPVPDQYTGTASLEDVQQAVTDSNKLVIDVREAPRYLGRTEPLDLIAGHIPGAVNLPYTSNLNENGKYHNAEVLKTTYDASIGGVSPQNVIVHCGSGVTACHTLLGMAQAGITEPKLYVGSWSEWSRRNLPIGTEDKPLG